MKSKPWLIEVCVSAAVTGCLTLSATVAPAEDCKEASEQYGRIVKILKEPADCRYAYAKIVDLCPSHVEARMKLADALLDIALADAEDPVKHAKLLDDAAAHYEKAVTYDKTLFEAYKSLGRIYWLQGRYSMAAEAFKKAVSLKPADRSVRAALEAVEEESANDAGTFRDAGKIVGAFEKGRATGNKMKTMGFREYTVAKDRQQFSNILFKEWSYEVRDKDSVTQLQEIGKALSSPQMNDACFVVEGHTDNRGDPQRNQRLSEQRARAVKQFLVDRFGIDSSKIVTQGFGFSRPQCPNDSAEHMRQNRRVEIVFR